jgi:hypothetical protein
MNSTGIAILFGVWSILISIAAFTLGSATSDLQNQLLRISENSAWQKKAIEADAAFYHPTTGQFTFRSAGTSITVISSTKAIEASK